MPLTFEEKKALVAEVSTIASKSQAAAVAKYSGLTVADMTSLRRKASHSNMRVKVIPKNLAKRAFKETDLACLEDHINGPVLFIFSENELGGPARLVKEYSKTNEKLQPVAFAVGNQLYTAKDLDRVASLPTKEEALIKLLVVMQAPISKFVRTLAEPHAKVVRALAAIKNSKSS